MASQFQHRLIGTIILVAIGVIVLPDLFDGKKEHYKEEFASIPLQPQMGGQNEAKTIPEPENADVVLPKEPVTTTIAEHKAPKINNDKPEVKKDEPQPVKPIIVAKPKPKPVVEKVVVAPKPQPAPKKEPKKEAVTDSAWVIKMGTFGNFKNANALVAKLRLNGYQANLVPRHPKSGEYVKVFVGPDVSKTKLAGQINALQKITGLHGKLNRFDAINP